MGFKNRAQGVHDGLVARVARLMAAKNYNVVLHDHFSTGEIDLLAFNDAYQAIIFEMKSNDKPHLHRKALKQLDKEYSHVMKNYNFKSARTMIAYYDKNHDIAYEWVKRR